MRIWSIHPKYLDTKGLTAVWRETLLAKHVLEGKTKGYTNHPQLIRFKNSEYPLDCINRYLSIIYEEACMRGYNYDQSKFRTDFKACVLPVTTGQVEYEAKHLLKKLQQRDYARYSEYKDLINWEIHPLFELVEGETESWEIQSWQQY